MAISVFLRFESRRDALMLYMSAMRELERRGGAAPAERFYHLAAVVPNGMFVASLWESREAFDAFAVAQTIPLTQKRGVDSPDVEFGEVYKTIEGAMPAEHGVVIVSRYTGDVDDLLRRCDAVNANSGLAKTPPAGFFFHWSAKRPDGICVVEHWRSRDDFEQFLNGPLGDAMRSAGMPQTHVEYYEICNAIDGRRVHA